ncbi:MAG: hypothetical protein HYS25_06685 [Ignavibacteriales bacterium]|nr:hypothetical protein [Ignavibacteriales bacterium]
MKTYKVLLYRDYIVHIDAKNEEEAKSLAEFFIDGEKDCFIEKERKQYSFKISEIEMVMNDAFEVQELKEDL